MKFIKMLKGIQLLEAPRRWPIASVLSIAITILLITQIYQSGQSDNLEPLVRWSVSLYIALLASLSVTLTFNHRLSIIQHHLIALIVAIVVCLSVYYFLPPDLFEMDTVATFRASIVILILILIFHLWISMGSFLKTRDRDFDFWGYNLTLLRWVVEGLLFALVLYIGFSLALLALDNLFGIYISGKMYAYLWVFLLGVFHPWYILSKLPIKPSTETMSDDAGYGYRIITRYIAIPIVGIYMLILYLFGAKIVISQSLPRGWLGKLTLYFCLIAIIAYLFNRYLDYKHSDRISFLYKKWLPKILVIPTLLLWVAILARVSDYGITELRYGVMGIAVWLTMLALGYTFRPNAKISWIPLSLSIVMLFMLISGPINMFQSTVRSQKTRLQIALSEEGLLQNGILVPPQSATAIQGFSELSLFRFLEERTNLASLDIWSQEDPFWQNSNTDLSQTDAVIAYLGLRQETNTLKFNEIRYALDQLGEIDMGGYSSIFHFSIPNDKDDRLISLSKDRSTLVIKIADQNTWDISVQELMEAYRIHQKRYKENSVPWTFSMRNQNVSFAIYFLQLDASQTNNRLSINYASGVLLQ